MSFTFQPGSIPLLISIPHNGSFIPPAILETMTEAGKSSRDTDWFLDRLYDLKEARAASVLATNTSRYVIDLNRPQSDESLYPGQTTTGLVPKTRFDGEAIYLNDSPSSNEITRRVKEFWQPYHQKIEMEMNSMVEQHGVAMMLEAHSIDPVLPRLFDGTLPDFNIGTNHGTSCDESIQLAIENVLNSQDMYSFVVNERFVGGYNTRQYGQPEKNWHTIQIELSQATYLNRPSLSWNDEKAKQVQPVLQKIIQSIVQWLQT